MSKEILKRQQDQGNLRVHIGEFVKEHDLSLKETIYHLTAILQSYVCYLIKK